MNRNILTLILILLASFQGFSQKLDDENMTFLGVDFSKAKIIGERPEDAMMIKANLFNEWNALFRNEWAKYDIARFTQKKVSFNFDNVTANNKKVDGDKLITLNDHSITPAEAESVLRSYDSKGKSGLGCVYVVESFDKVRARAFIYVIFFDIATKKVIASRRLEGEAGGAGLKNYWARGIRIVTEQCQYYQAWTTK